MRWCSAIALHFLALGCSVAQANDGSPGLQAIEEFRTNETPRLHACGQRVLWCGRTELGLASGAAFGETRGWLARVRIGHFVREGLAGALEVGVANLRIDGSALVELTPIRSRVGGFHVESGVRLVAGRSVGPTLGVGTRIPVSADVALRVGLSASAMFDDEAFTAPCLASIGLSRFVGGRRPRLLEH